SHRKRNPSHEHLQGGEKQRAPCPFFLGADGIPSRAGPSNVGDTREQHSRDRRQDCVSLSYAMWSARDRPAVKVQAQVNVTAFAATPRSAPQAVAPVALARGALAEASGVCPSTPPTGYG